MPPKKKKVNNRPIATTSIPKKAVEKPPEEIQQPNPVEPDNNKQDSRSSNDPQRTNEEYDIDRAEIESLQLLVDQQQAKAEKEALRVIKALEQDSRTSKSSPGLDIDTSISDRILELIRAAEPISKPIQEPEAKILPRLAVTYGTLRGLGLPANKIEECLKAISDVEIDSAIEWMILNCDEGELDLDNRLNNGGSGPLPVCGATEIPQPVPQPAPSVPTTESANSPARLATPAADISDSESDTSLEIDVNTKWARTKVQLHILNFGKPKSFKLNPNDPKVQKLEAKIRALESDYEFRKKYAEFTFKELKKVAEDEELKRSLKAPRSVPLVKHADPVEAPKEPTTVEKPPELVPAGTDAIDQHSDSDEGGFFGHMLDEMPTEVTTAAGDIVRVHTLEFPKSWNQATPKSLLRDYVNRLDTHALISYRSIGGVTRVARAAVQIRWRSKPGQEWIIPDACPTLAQAEEYAALLALHSLSAPARAGFVGIRSTSVPVQLSSIGSLPPSARDLWKEFETRRKKEEDETNRQVWSNLRAIVEPKLAPLGTYKTNHSGKLIPLANQDTSPVVQPKAPLEEVPSLKKDFKARQASVAYQVMLQKVLSLLSHWLNELESNITRNTRLAFVTNGIALRMLESDGKGGTAFDEITHIIIDEVHERSIESDFLLIVLKSMMKHRPDLKYRTFPVKIQYLEDAIEFTKWTIDGDSPYALRDKSFSRTKSKRMEWSEETGPADDDDEETPASAAPIKLGKQYSPSTISTITNLDERRIPYDLILRLLEKICLKDSKHSKYSAAVLMFLPGLNGIRQLTDILGAHRNFGTQAFRIYPLHSSLPSESQIAVFDIPPSGVRNIVIFIKGITCVIDSGKHKEMRFDEKRQTSRLIETTVAGSNAAQRRGRAGRVQEGLRLHLFTKSRHDNLMVDNPLPEILRLSLADLALRIKIMGAHLGKFLLHYVVLGCSNLALTICASLNAKSPFLRPFGFETQADAAKSSFAKDNSDFLALVTAFNSWRRCLLTGRYTSCFWLCEWHYSYMEHQAPEKASKAPPQRRSTADGGWLGDR
ncbi:unnamed protein product [Rhizoctonia solani]|uniref:Helicase C-terminal domain-containing protein n=1 Tax=Rhizoctonia solani TaxID=456999 RepID=A0A8H3DE45_9AGAM|nr:unnamed protein product [Rhizoctonia solani]